MDKLDYAQANNLDLTSYFTWFDRWIGPTCTADGLGVSKCMCMIYQYIIIRVLVLCFCMIYVQQVQEVYVLGRTLPKRSTHTHARARTHIPQTHLRTHIQHTHLLTNSIARGTAYTSPTLSRLIIYAGSCINKSLRLYFVQYLLFNVCARF
jgi:hypothetical protein